MSRHAPGPWIFYADLPSTEPNWHIVTTANRMRVLANVHINPDSAMDIANARLIAAAPELLEALDEMTTLAIGPAGGVTLAMKRDAVTKARDAINRATGEAA